MSMNINFVATREIQVVKTGKIEVQTETADVWQTPTKVSYEIKAASDPVKAYFDWVLQQSQDEQVEVYAEDDVWCEGPVVGYKTYNPGKNHVNELGEWIRSVEEEGYTVKCEVW